MVWVVRSLRSSSPTHSRILGVYFFRWGCPKLHSTWPCTLTWMIQIISWVVPSYHILHIVPVSFSWWHALFITKVFTWVDYSSHLYECSAFGIKFKLTEQEVAEWDGLWIKWILILITITETYLVEFITQQSPLFLVFSKA